MSVTPKPHNWEVEEVDGGPIGVSDFWICHTCGASGGPVWHDGKEPPVKTSKWAFLAGSPAHIDSDDCDKAKEQIESYVALQAKIKVDKQAKEDAIRDNKEQRKRDARRNFATRVVDKIVRDLAHSKPLPEIQEKWKNLIVVELLNEDEYI